MRTGSVIKDSKVETALEDERLFFRVPFEPGDGTAREVAIIQDNLLDQSGVTSPVPTRQTLSALHRLRRLHRRSLAISQWPTWFWASVQRETELGTGFVLAPVFLLAGAATYFSLPVEPAWHSILLALTILVALRLWLRDASAAAKGPLAALLLVVTGVAVAQLQTHWRTADVTGSAVATTITGRVVSIEPRADGSARYTLDLLATERPRLRFAPERVRLTARNAVDGIGIGSGIKGYARLLPPSGPVRPGGYDFAFNSYFDGIGANGFFLGPPDVVEAAAPGGFFSPISATIEALRLALWRRIHAVSGGEAGAVSAALVTGHKGAISDATNDALRLSGLAHILSISGLHMALVAGTVMAFLRALFALAPDWASRRATKKNAAIIGFGAISVYLFLAGASVATQRSFIMLAVMLGALMSDRAAITMRNLAIAALAVIVIAPHEVAGPSFQMSFAATMALVAAYQWWAKRGDGVRYRSGSRDASIGLVMGRKAITFIVGLAMTSLIAGAASGFYGVWHFQRVATFGLLGNLLAMPIVSLITMPSAIAGVLLIPFGLDGFAFGLMAWSIEWVIAAAQWVSAHSPAGITGAMPTSALLLGSAGMIVLCALQTGLRWLGILLLLGGVLAARTDEHPKLVISEDATQIAMIGYGETLAANRSRPNSFTYEQWETAYKAADILKPEKVESLDFEALPSSHTNPWAFSCDPAGRCLGTFITETGKPVPVLTLGKPPENGVDPCGKAAIIVESYAPAKIGCSGETLVITAQQLALRGSAEVYLMENRTTGRPTFRVQHAIGEYLRPWHAHRVYSRPARNLGPIERRKAPSTKSVTVQ